MTKRPNQIKIADALKPILAETVQLYVLTQNVHWNVTGPLFQSIHLLTEEQYTELATAVDGIAERIRMLGQKAPANLKAYQELGGIPDGDENATATVMVKALADAHSYIASRIRPLVNTAAEEGDEVTAGLLIDRLTIHEKANWMLSATIG
ncbi:MAG: DNA starvation/stationary phase protection protein [Kordiimonadaceae bacterium]|nr:DNA starvation/stationary phase protection protein [Kordiimonadaceae bacterium]MBL4788944.1 DNA starvation/stationary phase protection protein [Kordiimonadaceae bacterium]